MGINTASILPFADRIEEELVARRKVRLNESL